MSDGTKRTLEVSATVAVGILAVGGFLSSWFILPYRVSQNEKQIDALAAIQRADHDILTGMVSKVDDLHDWLRNKSAAAQASGK